MRPYTNANDPCVPFQVDLSCLADRELKDDGAVRRTLVHLEICARCRGFFHSIERQVRMHRHLAQGAGLLGEIAALDGTGLFTTFEARENLRRLAVVLYRLGKAYLLLAVDRGYLLEVFREPVEPVAFKASGWRFAGQILARTASRGGAKWVEARELLNGKLDAVESSLEKARTLLEEALVVRPRLVEARLYLGFYRKTVGDAAGAEQAYREVFATARRLANRAHAAIQLAMLHHDRGDLDRAAETYEWVVRRRVPERDGRFFFVHYNLGVVSARLGREDRAVEAFGALRRHFPRRLARVREYLRDAPSFLGLLERRTVLRERLARSCPELFAASSET